MDLSSSFSFPSVVSSLLCHDVRADKKVILNVIHGSHHDIEEGWLKKRRKEKKKKDNAGRSSFLWSVDWRMKTSDM